MRMLALFLALTFCGYAQEVAGDWHGWIEIKNDAPLRLALHIARGAGLAPPSTAWTKAEPAYPWIT